MDTHTPTECLLVIGAMFIDTDGYQHKRITVNDYADLLIIILNLLYVTKFSF